MQDAMFISIRKYLYSDAPAGREGNQALRDFCAALIACGQKALHAIEQHTFTGDQAKVESLRGRIRTLGGRLQQAESPDTVDGVAEDVVKVLAEHGRLTRESDIEKAAEFQKIVAMLNQTVVVLSTGSRRSVGRLRQIEKDLEGASQIQDILSLKSRLSECLTFIREETAREREDVARTVLTMDEEVRKACDTMMLSKAGLPGRPEAERLFTDLLQEAKTGGKFVAVFSLDRCNSIQSRFGAAAGDQVFRDLAKKTVLGLAAPKQVFRWGPGTLVALIERSETLEKVQSEIQHMNAEPLDIKVEVGGRMAVLTVSSRWLVFPLSEARELAWLASEIDAFTGGSTPGGS